MVFGFWKTKTNMDGILDEVVSPSDLKKFESKYNEEQKRGQVSTDVKFDYALCLVRSQYPADIQRGIHLFEDLYNKNPDGRRDYLYFMAIGHARLKEYQKSLKYLRMFQDIEPVNNQVEALIKEVSERLYADGRRGALAVGGGILALGVAVGAGFLLAKK